MNKFDKPYRILDFIDKDKGTKLFELVQTLDINEILQYAQKNKISLNFTNEYGNNLIHETILNTSSDEKNKLNIIKILVNNGVNPDCPNKNNQTPLHIAAENQNELIVKYLLEIGVNPNYQDNLKAIPLHYLCIGNIKKENIIESSNFINNYDEKNNDEEEKEILEIKKTIWEKMSEINIDVYNENKIININQNILPILHIIFKKLNIGSNKENKYKIIKAITYLTISNLETNELIKEYIDKYKDIDIKNIGLQEILPLNIVQIIDPNLVNDNEILRLYIAIEKLNYSQKLFANNLIEEFKTRNINFNNNELLLNKINEYMKNILSYDEIILIPSNIFNSIKKSILYYTKAIIYLSKNSIDIKYLEYILSGILLSNMFYIINDQEIVNSIRVSLEQIINYIQNYNDTSIVHKQSLLEYIFIYLLNKLKKFDTKMILNIIFDSSFTIYYLIRTIKLSGGLNTNNLYNGIKNDELKIIINNVIELKEYYAPKIIFKTNIPSYPQKRYEELQKFYNEELKNFYKDEFVNESKNNSLLKTFSIDFEIKNILKPRLSNLSYKNELNDIIDKYKDYNINILNILTTFFSNLKTDKIKNLEDICKYIYLSISNIIDNNYQTHYNLINIGINELKYDIKSLNLSDKYISTPDTIEINGLFPINTILDLIIRQKTKELHVGGGAYAINISNERLISQNFFKGNKYVLLYLHKLLKIDNSEYNLIHNNDLSLEIFNNLILNEKDKKNLYKTISTSLIKFILNFFKKTLENKKIHDKIKLLKIITSISEYLMYKYLNYIAENIKYHYNQISFLSVEKVDKENNRIIVSPPILMKRTIILIFGIIIGLYDMSQNEYIFALINGVSRLPSPISNIAIGMIVGRLLILDKFNNIINSPIITRIEYQRFNNFVSNMSDSDKTKVRYLTTDIAKYRLNRSNEYYYELLGNQIMKNFHHFAIDGNILINKDTPNDINLAAANGIYGIIFPHIQFINQIEDEPIPPIVEKVIDQNSSMFEIISSQMYYVFKNFTLETKLNGFTRFERQFDYIKYNTNGQQTELLNSINRLIVNVLNTTLAPPELILIDANRNNADFIENTSRSINIELRNIIQLINIRNILNINDNILMENNESYINYLESNDKLLELFTIKTIFEDIKPKYDIENNKIFDFNNSIDIFTNNTIEILLKNINLDLPEEIIRNTISKISILNLFSIEYSQNYYDANKNSKDIVSVFPQLNRRTQPQFYNTDTMIIYKLITLNIYSNLNKIRITRPIKINYLKMKKDLSKDFENINMENIQKLEIQTPTNNDEQFDLSLNNNLILKNQIVGGGIRNIKIKEEDNKKLHNIFINLFKMDCDKSLIKDTLSLIDKYNIDFIDTDKNEIYKDIYNTDICYNPFRNIYSLYNEFLFDLNNTKQMKPFINMENDDLIDIELIDNNQENKDMYKIHKIQKLIHFNESNNIVIKKEIYDIIDLLENINNKDDKLLKQIYIEIIKISNSYYLNQSSQFENFELSTDLIKFIRCIGPICQEILAIIYSNFTRLQDNINNLKSEWEKGIRNVKIGNGNPPIQDRFDNYIRNGIKEKCISQMGVNFESLWQTNLGEYKVSPRFFSNNMTDILYRIDRNSGDIIDGPPINNEINCNDNNQREFFDILINRIPEPFELFDPNIIIFEIDKIKDFMPNKDDINIELWNIIERLSNIFNSKNNDFSKIIKIDNKNPIQFIYNFHLAKNIIDEMIYGSQYRYKNNENISSHKIINNYNNIYNGFRDNTSFLINRYENIKIFTKYININPITKLYSLTEDTRAFIYNRLKDSLKKYITDNFYRMITANDNAFIDTLVDNANNANIDANIGQPKLTVINDIISSAIRYYMISQNNNLIIAGVNNEIGPLNIRNRILAIPNYNIVLPYINPNIIINILIKEVVASLFSTNTKIIREYPKSNASKYINMCNRGYPINIDLIRKIHNNIELNNIAEFGLSYFRGNIVLKNERYYNETMFILPNLNNIIYLIYLYTIRYLYNQKEFIDMHENMKSNKTNNEMAFLNKNLIKSSILNILNITILDDTNLNKRIDYIYNIFNLYNIINYDSSKEIIIKNVIKELLFEIINTMIEKISNDIYNNLLDNNNLLVYMNESYDILNSPSNYTINLNNIDIYSYHKLIEDTNKYDYLLNIETDINNNLLFSNNLNNNILVKQNNILEINKNILDLLLDYGSKIYLNNTNGESPLFILIKNYQYEKLDIIIKKKIIINNDIFIDYIKKDIKNNIDIIFEIKNNYYKISNPLSNISKYLCNSIKEDIINKTEFGENILNNLCISFDIITYIFIEFLSEQLLDVIINKDYTNNDLVKLLDLLEIKNTNLTENYLIKLLYNSGKGKKSRIYVDKNIMLDEIIKKKIDDKRKLEELRSNYYDSLSKIDDTFLKTKLGNKHNYNEQITSLEAEINKYEELIKIRQSETDEFINTDQYNDLSSIMTNIDKYLKLNNILNTDELRIKIWEKFLDKKLFQDNIPKNKNLLLLYLFYKEYDINDKNINIFEKSLEHIKKFCEGYFIKNKFVNDNFILKHIKQIILYLTKIIICYNIELFMKKIMFQYFIQSKQQINNDIKLLFDKINVIFTANFIKPNTQNEPLNMKKVLYNELSEKFILSSIELYDNEYHKNTYINKSIRELLNDYFGLLRLIPNIIIPEQLIKILQTELVDYFDSFISKTILLWHVNCENILKFTINNYKQVKTLSVIGF